MLVNCLFSVYVCIIGICLGSAKLQRLMNEKWSRVVKHVERLVAVTRKVTLCLDGWSRQGLSAAYLGISVCFFDPSAHVARHFMLNLTTIKHPHTAPNVAACVSHCLDQWKIPAGNVLMLVTDSGSNMVKAMKLLKEQSETLVESEAEQGTESDYEDNEEDCDSEQNAEKMEDEDLPVADVRWLHMRCMAHSLQLIAKIPCKHYEHIITKARSIGSRIRRSSVAVQKLIEFSGKCVVTDNSTRWNSTYRMMQRLLELKSPVCEVLLDLQVDSLMVTEWAKLEEIADLLQPFLNLTNVLQTDSTSLSSVIPSILDLEVHLQSQPPNVALARNMVQDLRYRFDSLLNPCSGCFNPLCAASCLLDPTVAVTMLLPEMHSLVEAAKQYIIAEVDIIDFIKGTHFLLARRYA